MARRVTGCRPAIVVLALTAALGCGREAVRREGPPDIVMIVLDTARPDMLSVYGHPLPTSPFLETFAAEGTRFDRAYSSSSWTLPAHGSLFTGRSPKVHRANQTRGRVSDSLPLLAEELAAAGYQTAGFSANVWVSELGGLDRGFEHFEGLNKNLYGPHIAELAADPRGDRIPPRNHYVASRVREFMETARDPDRPLFLFVNLVEPHLPYLPDWRSARHFMPSRRDRWTAIQHFYPEADVRALMWRHYDGRYPLSTGEWESLTRMYQGALRLTDEIAGDIVAEVERVSDPASSLIFLLSDHGENLGDHGHFTHIFNLYDTNLKIVCIARGPGFRAGAVDKRLVHITDLHATALGAAGLPRQPGDQGLDLRQEPGSDRVVTAFLEYPRISLGLFADSSTGSAALDVYRVELQAAVSRRFKLIRSIDPSGAVREAIYDLAADPGELSPLAADAVAAPVLERLRAALIESSAPAEPGEELDLDAIDEDHLEGLRALGYVGHG